MLHTRPSLDLQALDERLRAAFLAQYGLQMGTEVAAETMAWAWEHRDELSEMDNPAGYLFRVGQSRSRRFIRWQREHLRLPPERDDVSSSWTEPQLENTLAALGDEERTAVILVHCFQWTYAEVGELLQLPVTTIRNRLHRGLSRLRVYLGVDHDVSDEFAEVEGRLAAYGGVLRNALAAAREAHPADGPVTGDEPGHAIEAGTSWSHAAPEESDSDVVPLTGTTARKYRPRRARRAAAVVGVAAALIAAIALAAPRLDRDGVRAEFAEAANAIGADGGASGAGDSRPAIAGYVDPDQGGAGSANKVPSSSADGLDPTATTPDAAEAGTGHLDEVASDAADASDAGPDGASGEIGGACSGDDDVIEHDGRCWRLGPQPTRAEGECPAGAVEVDGVCFREVDTRCHDSKPVDGGCLGPAVDDGDVDYVPARSTCASGSLVGNECVSEKARVAEAACPAGTTRIGNGCYELVDPQPTCGNSASVDGACWKPVARNEVTSCPTGATMIGNACYRYEDATVRCDAGQLVSGPRCKIVSEAQPGPEHCGPYLQDANGCYIITEPNAEGECGELPRLGGGCRYPKPSTTAWTCDGSVVDEPTCIRFEDATVFCSSGYLVDGARCKFEVPASVSLQCPDGAQPGGDGCVEPVEPVMGCGTLDPAPDGVHCKRWISEGELGGGCPAGYEPIGDRCKAFDEPTWTCDAGSFEYRSGQAVCRVENDGRDACTGDGVVWFDGKCHLVVPPTCGDLDESPRNPDHCKKPVERAEGGWECPAGFRLVRIVCITPVDRN